MREIAKELQNRIIKETGFTCVIHIGKKCDVLLGSGWYEDINVDSDEFNKILNIVKETQGKYPGKIENSVCADVISPDTVEYLNSKGEFEVYTDCYRVLNFYKMQYNFRK